METHHIMEGPIDDQSLSQFIRNFSDSNLSRATESITTVKMKHVHLYPRKSDCEGDVCLSELDSKMFLETVMTKDKVSFLFKKMYCHYKSSFCIIHFCRVALKVYSQFQTHTTTLPTRGGSLLRYRYKVTVFL